ncbi:MAG: preprotein translocase subunit YajC [Rickettsiales bacterium]
MSFIIGDLYAAEETASSATTGTANNYPPLNNQMAQNLSAEKVMFDNFLILGVLFFIFYFMLIKPQKNRIKKHQDLIGSLKKGDKVITSGGIIGTIIKLEGDDVIALEIAQNVRIRMAKASIAEIADDKISDNKNANDN